MERHSKGIVLANKFIVCVHLGFRPLSPIRCSIKQPFLVLSFCDFLFSGIRNEYYAMFRNNFFDNIKPAVSFRWSIMTERVGIKRRSDLQGLRYYCPWQAEN